MNTTYEATSPITGKTYRRKSSRNVYAWAAFKHLEDGREFVSFVSEYHVANAAASDFLKRDYVDASAVAPAEAVNA